MPIDSCKGRIIVIPKTEKWHGDLDKLRPITLLESFRKILNNVLTKRLSKTLFEHKLLKGFNFGFQPGKSTSNLLFILRTIIDDANSTRKNILLAVLDVFKAYDSVPRESIIRSLRRFKVPESYIQLFINSE